MTPELAQAVLEEKRRRDNALRQVERVLATDFVVTGYPMDRVRTGQLHDHVCRALGLHPENPANRRMVNEALLRLGLRPIKVHGRRHMRGIARREKAA